MRRILGLMDAVSVWTGKIVCLLSLFVAVIITYEIIVRDFFHRPTVWVAEATVFACGLLYLLGGPWTLLEDKHVRVDMLYVRWTPRQRAVVDCLTYLCFALYLVVMIWATANYAWESVGLRETTMSPWNPAIWPMKLALLLALVMVLLQGTAKFIRNLHLAATGRPL